MCHFRGILGPHCSVLSLRMTRKPLCQLARFSDFLSFKVPAPFEKASAVIEQKAMRSETPQADVLLSFSNTPRLLLKQARVCFELTSPLIRKGISLHATRLITSLAFNCKEANCSHLPWTTRSSFTFAKFRRLETEMLIKNKKVMGVNTTIKKENGSNSPLQMRTNRAQKTNLLVESNGSFLLSKESGKLFTT